MFQRLAFILLLSASAAHGATLVLPARPTAEEQAFATALTNALEMTNIVELVALHYCESDEPWAAEWYFRQLVKHPCDEIKLERAEPAESSAYTEKLEGARASLPLRWFVLIRQPPLPFEAASTNLIVLPAGLLDGRIVITRRMGVFTPYQKQLLLASAATAVLMAGWHLLKFVRSRRRGAEAVRYSPLGLAVFLVLFALECVAVVFAMFLFVPHPLRMLILPILGLLSFFVAAFYDERRRVPAATSEQPQDNSPASALTKTWKAWKNKEGPFSSGRARFAIRLVITVFACYLGWSVWRGVSITLHEQHAQGTVIHSGRRQGVRFRYEVNGREYSGSGVGNSDRVYPVGSPVDVKYSASHPAFSTIDDEAFLGIKQLACAAAFIGGFFFLANRKRRA
jgi:hypothetical protein